MIYGSLPALIKEAAALECLLIELPAFRKYKPASQITPKPEKQLTGQAPQVVPIQLGTEDGK